MLSVGEQDYMPYFPSTYEAVFRLIRPMVD